MKKYTSVSILALIFATFFFSLTSFAKNDIPEGLVVVKSKDFKKVWAKPGLSLNKYKSIVPVLSGIEYKKVRGNKNRNSEYTMPENEKPGVKNLFAGTFIRELMTSKRFPMLDKPGNDSLRLNLSLRRVICYVPPRAMLKNESTRNIISYILHVEVIDFSNGETLLILEDNHYVKSRNNLRISQPIADVKRLKESFQTRAEKLKGYLEKLGKK